MERYSSDKNDKIYEMDANKLSRPGPRLLEGAADIQAVLEKNN